RPLGRQPPRRRRARLLRVPARAAAPGRGGAGDALLLVEGRLTSIASQAAAVAARLEAANQAREAGLAACRSTIRASASAIRAVHQNDPDAARTKLCDAEAALARAQAVLEAHPALRHSGFLHDAAKEYVEARATVALV